MSAVACASSIGLAVPANAATAFIYSLDAENNATVTGCDGACPADLVIPATVDGNPVTAVAAHAFQGQGLSSVSMADSITSIGEYAFFNNVLTSVRISQSITDISNYAFYYNSLSSVTIPNSVTRVGDAAFFLNALTSLTIPSSVSTISQSAFAVNSLTSLTIPANVGFLGEYAFASNSLTTVTFEGNAPSSSRHIFDSNSGLAALDVYQGTSGWFDTYSGMPVNVVAAPAPTPTATPTQTSSPTATPTPSITGNAASAPRIRTSRAGRGRIFLGIWSPKNSGGTSITGYEFTVDDGATWTPVDPSSTTHSLVISGLSNGTRYTVKVRAVNGAGGGAASNARVVTPGTVAGAPVITSLVAHNRAIKVEFDAPASNGGRAITRYAYSVNGGQWHNFGASTSPLVIKALPNGVVCAVQIKALNAAGWGASSIAVEATPHR